MDVSDEMPQCGSGTEGRIHLVIVLCVVLVVAGGSEDGIQVEDVRTQRPLDVAQLLVDARQIAAEEDRTVAALGSGENARAPRVPLGRASRVGVLAVRDVVGRVAVVEPVREDLIHHPTLHPVRGLEARDDEEVARRRLPRGDSGRVEPGHWQSRRQPGIGSVSPSRRRESCPASSRTDRSGRSTTRCIGIQ